MSAWRLDHDAPVATDDLSNCRPASGVPAPQVARIDYLERPPTTMLVMLWKATPGVGAQSSPSSTIPICLDATSGHVTV